MAPTSIRISSPPRRARFGNYDGLTRSAQDEKEREEMLKCRREKGMSHVCSTSAFLTRSPEDEGVGDIDGGSQVRLDSCGFV
jgi:hypothetical protein